MEEKKLGIVTVGQRSWKAGEEGVGSGAKGTRDEEYPKGCEKE